MYLTNTILCVMLIGYLTSYIIALSSYYTYMLRNDRVKELQVSYAPFRTDSNTKILHRVCFVLQVVFAVVLLLLDCLTRPLPAQVYALTILPIFLAIRVVAGLGKVEEEMASGKELMEPEIDLYVKFNLPLHLAYAVLYLIGATWLIVTPF